ncbi:MAG: carboxypeptidase-like regulatory domain-containing protein [Thermoanaerobaculia bacterium]|nr:carboxypeptidase-like regulatory domain-containing protein [Thermoanaerobaculia bacterium]
MKDRFLVLVVGALVAITTCFPALANSAGPAATEPTALGVTQSNTSAEDLLSSLEARLSSLADQWERGDLAPGELGLMRRSLRRQLARVVSAGGGDDEEFQTRLFLLDAQVGLFPGPGPKRSPTPLVLGGGAIFGRVTDEVTAVGIVGAELRAYSPQGYYVGNDYSGVDGYYSLGGLAPGTYRVTVSHNGHVGELWNNLVCHPYCDPTTGQPIGVTNGTPGSGVDFALAATGSISGAFEEDGTGTSLSGWLEFWSVTGTYLFDDYVYGDYTVSNLAPGNYFINSYNYDGLADELYDDLPCENGPPTGCDPTDGTPVGVTSGQTTTGIDFRLPLSSKGRIAGSVTNSSTGAPLSGYYIDVIAYDENGNSFGYSDVYGGEYLIDGLEPGDYTVWARASEQYSSELWPEIPCEYPCDITQGTAVTVVFQETTDGIDFTLDPPGSIEGRVTDESGIPILGVEVTTFGDGNNEYTTTDTDGHFRIPGLKANIDFNLLATSGYHRDELWENVPCEPSCDWSLGTPITVTPNQVIDGLNFALERSGTLGGTVSADSTGTLLKGVFLDLYNSAGQSVGYAYTDGLGEYRIQDLGSGPYFLRAYYYQFLSELFEDIDCSDGCDPTTGTPITTGSGMLTEIDFALSRFGRIKGRVTSSLTGQPLQSCQLRADATTFARYTYTDSDGQFRFDDLVAETYLLTAADCDGLAGRLYDDVYCPGGACDANDATPITVSLNELLTNIDFTLGPAVLFLDGFESGDTSSWDGTSP